MKPLHKHFQIQTSPHTSFRQQDQAETTSTAARVKEDGLRLFATEGVISGHVREKDHLCNPDIELLAMGFYVVC